MTSSNHNNDLITSQEKLEWVTPKISLMGAEETEGSGKNYAGEEIPTGFPFTGGPS